MSRNNRNLSIVTMAIVVVYNLMTVNNFSICHGQIEKCEFLVVWGQLYAVCLKHSAPLMGSNKLRSHVKCFDGL